MAQIGAFKVKLCISGVMECVILSVCGNIANPLVKSEHYTTNTVFFYHIVRGS